MEWEILLTPEVEAFLDKLYESDPVSHQLVNQASLVLDRNGPAEGRPLVDTITSSRAVGQGCGLGCSSPPCSGIQEGPAKSRSPRTIGRCFTSSTEQQQWQQRPII